MTSLGTPVNKADAVKLDKCVRSRQPKVAVLSRRDRVDECRWKSVFMRPDSLRVLGERLRRGERADGQQREGTTYSREDGVYQTACQRRSHGHTLLILLGEQESKKYRVRIVVRARVSGTVIMLIVRFVLVTGK